MANNTIARHSNVQTISRRMYNGLCFGLVTCSFLVMFAMYRMVLNGGLVALIYSGAGLPVLIGSFVGTMAGLIMMGVARSHDNLGLSIAGYVLFSLTFGLTLAVALLNYTSYQITTAIGITACLSGIFFIAGLLYPEVFERISGILMLSLLGLIIAEVIAMFFFHADQTIFDYIAIAIFCGFIGFDSYKMAMDEPTVPNAIFHASDIYVDIANILLRVLRILNSDN